MKQHRYIMWMYSQSIGCRSKHGYPDKTTFALSRDLMIINNSTSKFSDCTNPKERTYSECWTMTMSAQTWNKIG